MICSNCNTKLSCGCQSRKASDGKIVCSNCIASYEAKISKALQSTSSSQNAEEKPGPTNISVRYIPPHNRLP